MTTVTELAVTTEDVALSETFEALPDLEMRIKSVIAEGPQQTMPLIWIAGAPNPEIKAALDADSSVDQYSCLLEDGDANEWLYRIEYASGIEEICSTIFSNNGTILDAQCSASNWTFRLLVPERDLLSETISELEDQDIQVVVQRVAEAGRTTDLEVTTALTEAQEKAINEAYERGYFDVPRRISLEELAAEVGISHQALSERLRRANKVLASEQIGETSQDGITH